MTVHFNLHAWVLVTAALLVLGIFFYWKSNRGNNCLNHIQDFFVALACFLLAIGLVIGHFL